MTGDRARDVDDVVDVERAIDTGVPVEHSARDIEVTAQATLYGVRHYLLEIRIANQRIVDQARPYRIGAAEFERRRCAIRFRVAAVNRDRRRELVGRAENNYTFAVAASVQQQTSATEEIARSVTNASDGAKLIGTALSEMADSSNGAKQSAQTVLTASEKVEQTVGDLRSEVESFLVKVAV